MKKILVILIGSFLLTSCGWEPLYAERKSKSAWYFGGEFDNSISTEMTKIKVENIEGRFGQEIRNELMDSLTPKGAPRNPKYRLHVDVMSKIVVQQALREDITATRERVRYQVTYKMEQDGNELLEGDSVAFVSYDVLVNPYSTTIAQKKAESNAAKIIADDIALRVGAYFHTEISKKDVNGGI